MIEHWVHLRCTVIRLSQYTDNWTCYLHKESRLTHTQPTPLKTTYRHTSNTPLVPTGLIKPKPNPLTPIISKTARPKHIHISHTPPTLLIPHSSPNTSAAQDTIHEPRGQHTYSCPTLTATIPPLPCPTHQHCRYPRTLSAHSHPIQTTLHAPQSLQLPHPPHRVPRQPHRQTTDI